MMGVVENTDKHWRFVRRPPLLVTQCDCGKRTITCTAGLWIGAGFVGRCGKTFTPFGELQHKPSEHQSG
jgi:hypothetical protein